MEDFRWKIIRKDEFSDESKPFGVVLNEISSPQRLKRVKCQHRSDSLWFFNENLQFESISLFHVGFLPVETTTFFRIVVEIGSLRWMFDELTNRGRSIGFAFVLETLQMFRFFIGFFISSISERRFLKEKKIRTIRKEKLSRFTWSSFRFVRRVFEIFPLRLSFVRFDVDFLL